MKDAIKKVIDIAIEQILKDFQNEGPMPIWEKVGVNAEMWGRHYRIFGALNLCAQKLYNCQPRNQNFTETFVKDVLKDAEDFLKKAIYDEVKKQLSIDLSTGYPQDKNHLYK